MTRVMLTLEIEGDNVVIARDETGGELARVTVSDNLSYTAHDVAISLINNLTDIMVERDEAVRNDAKE